MPTYILSIETATTVCSVALFDGSELVAESTLNIQNSHAERLTRLIEDLLAHIHIAPKDLSAIAISKGPGSYTGLRIGVSTAKGLCFALGIPLISVETLKAMAWQVNISNATKMLLCPMIDARRMEVYCAVFDANLDNILPTEAKILDESSFEDTLQKPTLFFGNGAFKLKDICHNPNAFFIDELLPSARYIGKLAFEAFSNKTFEDVVYFEPYYLKDFVSTTPKNKQPWKKLSTK